MVLPNECSRVPLGERRHGDSGALYVELIYGNVKVALGRFSELEQWLAPCLGGGGTGSVEYMRISSRIGILNNLILVEDFLELVLYIASSCAFSRLQKVFRPDQSRLRAMDRLLLSRL